MLLHILTITLLLLTQQSTGRKCDQKVLNLSVDLILDSLVSRFPQKVELGAFSTVFLKEGTFTLRQGDVKGLQTIERVGNAYLSDEKGKLKLEMNLKFNDLSIQYADYDIALKNERQTGKMYLSVVNNVTVVGTFRKNNVCTFKIESIKVNLDRPKVDFKCVICGKLDNSVDTNIRGIIDKQVDTEILEALEGFLKHNSNIADKGSYCKRQ